MPPALATLLKETAVIAIASIAIALIANAVSPRGLPLSRTAATQAASPASMPAPPRQEMQTPPPASAAPHTRRGLPLATHDEAAALFRDRRHAEGRILFIDARNAQQYAAGHVPGALRFDHYRPEQSVADVLAASTLAERIVVYCRGGECEDSDLVALDLIGLGIPAEKIAIYGGGFATWRDRGLPVQTGSTRGSGGRP